MYTFFGMEAPTRTEKITEEETKENGRDEIIIHIFLKACYPFFILFILHYFFTVLFLTLLELFLFTFILFLTEFLFRFFLFFMLYAGRKNLYNFPFICLFFSHIEMISI